MDSQIRGFSKTLTSELDTFSDGTDKRFVCRVASEPAFPGGVGVGEGKGEDLIGQFLTAQQQRSHRGFLGRNSNL